MKLHIEFGGKSREEEEQPDTHAVVDEAFKKGIAFLFAINPAYAYRWAVNNNAYTLSSILKKYEEVIRAERDREFIDFIKIGVFIMMVAVGLGLAVYLVLLATKGQLSMPGVPNIVPSGGGGYRI